MPSLIVDEQCLLENISACQSMLNLNCHARIVVKSLPSVDLLELVSSQLNTQRFMVFHQPFIKQIFERFAQANILLGKPMPINTVASFYQQNITLNDQQSIQWLIDTPQRLEQYLQLAKTLNQKLNINIEINVGLHRGGVEQVNHFNTLLSVIKNNPEYLNFSGLMGYDAHITKLPKILGSTQKHYAKSQAIYQRYIDIIQQEFPNLANNQLCFNGAGSPTLLLHKEKSVCNDLSFGSALLKPTDFDIETLSALKPALFIATPILKALPKTQLPGVGKLNAVLNEITGSRKAYFIYGGYWMAKYHEPKGLSDNALYGKSTNQHMVNAPKNCSLDVDDFIFLRPTQSEFVINQFKTTLLYNNGEFKALENLR